VVSSRKNSSSAAALDSHDHFSPGGHTRVDACVVGLRTANRIRRPRVEWQEARRNDCATIRLICRFEHRAYVPMRTTRPRLRIATRSHTNSTSKAGENSGISSSLTAKPQQQLPNRYRAAGSSAEVGRRGSGAPGHSPVLGQSHALQHAARNWPSSCPTPT